MMKQKYVRAVGLVVLVAVLGTAWWLLSPLFLNRTVDEPFPPATQQRTETLAWEDPPRLLHVQAGATPLAVGEFRDADSFHRGSGTATIYRLEDGRLFLRLEDFEVTNGPDLHVILSEHSGPLNQSEVKSGSYTDLGNLKGNQGDQNYELPADFDVSTVQSVVIYCQPFHVVFSFAPVEAAQASTAS